LRRTWVIACKKEGINPKAPSRIPRLFAVDNKLKVRSGFNYRRADTMADNSFDNDLVFPFFFLGPDFFGSSFDLNDEEYELEGYSDFTESVLHTVSVDDEDSSNSSLSPDRGSSNSDDSDTDNNRNSGRYEDNHLAAATAAIAVTTMESSDDDSGSSGDSGSSYSDSSSSSDSGYSSDSSCGSSCGS